MTQDASLDATVNRVVRIKRAPVYSCGGALLAGSGNITSPGFPAEYPQNALCHWTVEPMDLSRPVLLTFESFDIESDKECTYDSLTIIRNKAENSTYCNGNKAPTGGLVGRHFDLTFRSDGHAQRRGFLISYSPADNMQSAPVSPAALGTTWTQRPTGTTDDLPTTAHPEVSFTVSNKVTYTSKNDQVTTLGTRNDSHVSTTPSATQELLYTDETHTHYNTTSSVHPTTTHWPKHHTNNKVPTYMTNTPSVTRDTQQAVPDQSAQSIVNTSAWSTDATTVGTDASTDTPELGTVPSRMFTAKETIVGGIIIGIVPLSCAVTLLALYLRRTRERDTVAAIIQAITIMEEAIIEMEESVASEEEKDGVDQTDFPDELRDNGNSSPREPDTTSGDHEKNEDSQGHTDNEEGSSFAVTQPIAKDAAVETNNVAATSPEEWMSYHPISNKMKINVNHTKVDNTSPVAGTDQSEEETEQERIHTNGNAASSNGQNVTEGYRAVERATSREVSKGTESVKLGSPRRGDFTSTGTQTDACGSESQPGLAAHECVTDTVSTANGATAHISTAVPHGCATGSHQTEDKHERMNGGVVWVGDEENRDHHHNHWESALTMDRRCRHVHEAASMVQDQAFSTLQQVKELSSRFEDHEDELCRSSSLPSPMLHPQRHGKLSTSRLDMFDPLVRSNSDTSSSDTSLNCISFEDGSKLCKEWSFSTLPAQSRSRACDDPNKSGASNSEGPYDTPRRRRSRGYPDGKEDGLASKKLESPLPAKVYKRNVYTKTTVTDKVSLPNGDVEEHLTVSSEEDYTSSHGREDVSISIHHETTEIVEKYRTYDENLRTSTIERQSTVEKRSFSTCPKQASKVLRDGAAYGKDEKTSDQPGRKLNNNKQSSLPAEKSTTNKDVSSRSNSC
ncbi:CDCP2 [Branchiostoma lanceolatum]|uniref:CDCP2 protein n=1 Tax=Branchiostoma lanceolatum TaxID=7740 RepID=A0A8K0ELK9_BRALA|nr:CDCP2 [Branchiostoma lanceolatum]